MESIKYSRGSEWRKWDLHVHTPASGLSNGFEGDWDNYVKTLFTLAIERGVAVLGITDYFTIEGYEKIIKDYIEKEAKLMELFETPEMVEKVKSILLLPNIEFRLDKMVGQNRVNYHVIFSNHVRIDDIKENFLQEIEFVYEATPFSKDNTRKLTRHNIEELGKKIKLEQTTFSGSDFEIGCTTAIVQDGQIRDILNSHSNLFKDKYLIAVPVDEDLSDVDWKNQGHQFRKVLYQQSNIFFSSNKSTIKFGHGEKHSSKEEYLQEFKSFKPCVIGSDAHSIEMLQSKLGRQWTTDDDTAKTTWIKADPTFEGLRQIIFEPESRVRIQEMSPDSKAEYQVIDTITLREPGFWNGDICLNPYLNTIIGGRSTGKSTLLQCIAKKLGQSIGKDEDGKKGMFVNQHYNTLSIRWKDGEVDTQREIMFFPQNHMIELATDGQELNKLLEKIVKEKDEHQLLDEYKKFLGQNQITISGQVNQLFLEQSKLNDQIVLKKQKGDEKGIESEILKIQAKIEKIKSDSQISEEEIKKYNELATSIAQKQGEIKTIENDIRVLDGIIPENIFNLYYKNELDSLSEEERNKLITKLDEIKGIALDNWKKELLKAKTSLHDARQKKIQEVESIQSSIEYKKGNEYFQKNKEYRELQELLKTEIEKLASIKEIDKIIQQLKTNVENMTQSVIVNHLEYYSKIKDLMDNLAFEYSNVSISLKKYLKEKQLRTFLEERHNLRGYERQEYIDNFVKEYRTDHIEEITKQYLIDALANDLEYKGGYMVNNVVSELLSTNWFDITYHLEYEKDSFDDMSQGKKSFVILKLLLDFSEKRCPILLDQPEDSLDNRAIYNDLVEYLRRKKLDRQLIIVTHNSNVVVSADSENVIVANQSGIENKNRDGIKFQYINGALENTKPKNKNEDFILESQGIREHVCEILEGGVEAFKKREQKYGI